MIKKIIQFSLLIFLSVKASCFLDEDVYNSIKWNDSCSSITFLNDSLLLTEKGKNYVIRNYEKNSFKKVNEKAMICFSNDEQYAKIPKIIEDKRVKGMFPLMSFTLYILKKDSLEECRLQNARDIKEVLDEVKKMKNTPVEDLVD